MQNMNRLVVFCVRWPKPTHVYVYEYCLSMLKDRTLAELTCTCEVYCQAEV